MTQRPSRPCASFLARSVAALRTCEAADDVDRDRHDHRAEEIREQGVLNGGASNRFRVRSVSDT